MECHGDSLPGRCTNTGVTSAEEGHDVDRITVMRNDVDKDTMSTMVKLAKEIDVLRDIGQPTAACQLMVLPSRKQLVTRGVLRPAQGGADRHRGACLRHGVTDDVFPRQPRQVVESGALLFSLGQSIAKAGFLVKSMSLIPTNMVAQACERVRLRRLLCEACYDQAETDTVTLNEEHGEVTSAEEERRRPPLRIDDVSW